MSIISLISDPITSISVLRTYINFLSSDVLVSVSLSMILAIDLNNQESKFIILNESF